MCRIKIGCAFFVPFFAQTKKGKHAPHRSHGESRINAIFNNNQPSLLLCLLKALASFFVNSLSLKKLSSW